MPPRRPWMLPAAVAVSSCLGPGACGRVGYEHVLVTDGGSDAGDGSVPDGGADGGPDAGPDGGRPPCDWSLGPPAFGAPAKVAGVNSSSDEGDPVPSPDELVLRFTSARTGAGDFYVSSRASRADAFGTPMALMELNTPSNESKLAMTADRLDVVFSSSRPGGSGLADLYEATRASTASPFSGILGLGTVNSTNDDFDPFLSPDGLVLHFAPRGRAGGMGLQDLFVATRPSRASAFSSPTPLPNVNSVATEDDPSITGDGLVLVFSTDRGGTSDLFYATRTSTSQPFGVPQPINAVNTNADEIDPSVSADGCAIYYVMDPAADPNAGEIFVVRAP